tara:strand:+ start:326 stop:454 length:129 start_codon:yes stop_codon:yes gene_type:complete
MARARKTAAKKAPKRKAVPSLWTKVAMGLEKLLSSAFPKRGR